ncbi:MFS transporter permease [Skermanella stibiiresistens SB22]|uniref:MFS transporter permease n=1 Tax=Skermanella stibiiresistens SB22 TaxID=1385369 RepID=W9GUY8_9PROT|nr:MFS transporter permease [Skermanella stibiiresistens SB22]
MASFARWSSAPVASSSWTRAASVYLDRRIIAIMFLGFSSGLPLALTGATLSVWLVEGGIAKTAIGLFALVGLPYTLKFAWAPLIDRLRLPLLTGLLGRRRGWAVLTQLGLMLALIGLGSTDPVTELWWMALFAVLVSFCSASQDIVLDAWRVEILDEDQYGAGAAAVVLGYRIGMLTSGAGALYLASALPWSMVYLIMAGLVGVGLITMLLNREPDIRVSPESEQRERVVAEYLERRPGLRGWRAEALAWLFGAVVAPFADFMTRRSWLAVLLFIAIYKLGDVYAGAMATPFYLELGFTKIEIANVTKAFGLGASIIGGLLGGVVVSRFGVTRSLLVCGLLQMVSNLMFVLLARSGHDIGMMTVVIAVENVTGGMGTAAFVAYLSSLCNVAYTATQYALLSSFSALGRDVLAASSGWLADRMDWVSYYLLSTSAALPGLLLLLWLMRGTGAQAPARRPAGEAERA